MNWNPDQYNKFKAERNQPFFDLMALVTIRPSLQVVDLGCGTGELTQKLAEMLPGATVTGIDSSPEMLERAKAYGNARLQFYPGTIEDFADSKSAFDLIFSNAALQWTDDHEILLPKIINRIKPGGQLAIQLPSNHHHFSHQALAALADVQPYRQALQECNRTVAVLDHARYAELLYQCGGKNIVALEKVYPHVLANGEAVFEWTSGTAILRYLRLLPDALKEPFRQAYRQMLLDHYANTSPVFYPFKRILFSATF